MYEIQKLHEIIKESENIVFFGGAGVSTESGIPDFRSEQGLYNSKEKLKYRPETILSHNFFMTHTREFYKYYRENMLHTEAEPNLCHKSLAYLEKIGKLKAVVTQNIDGLHQKAGSKNVYELHGTIYSNHCMKCGEHTVLTDFKDEIPRCKKCGGIMKPDVVLYGEPLPSYAWESSEKAIENCDTLIVGGTSLTVYPASMLVSYFKGKHLVIINRDATQFDETAEILIRKPIGEVFSEAVKNI